MCEPATALAVASGLASFIGQSQVASMQKKANEQARNMTIQNQELQIRSLNNAEDENSRRASQALRDNQKAASATRATAQVAAGESGVAGLSLDALLGDLSRQESTNNQNIKQTLDFQQQQIQLNREGVAITAQSQINQLPLVEYPSFFDAASQTALAVYTMRD